MIDFERTYRARRAICRALQQSQKSESQIAERSGQIAVNGKRELLLLFSEWLLGLNSASAMPETERRELQSLTQMPLEKWVQLQAIAVQIEKDLKEAEGKEKEAIAAFQKKAPFGAATKVFADAESKSQIKTLQNDVAAAQKYHEILSLALKQNVEKRQGLGETFFRDCLAQLDKLAISQAFGKEATLIINRMTTETNAVWVGHLKQQAEELDQIAKLIQTLRVSYNDTAASPPQPRKMVSPQEQSETQSQKVSL